MDEPGAKDKNSPVSKSPASKKMRDLPSAQIGAHAAASVPQGLTPPAPEPAIPAQTLQAQTLQAQPPSGAPLSDLPPPEARAPVPEAAPGPALPPKPSRAPLVALAMGCAALGGVLGGMASLWLMPKFQPANIASTSTASLELPALIQRLAKAETNLAKAESSLARLETAKEQESAAMAERTQKLTALEAELRAAPAADFARELAEAKSAIEALRARLAAQPGALSAQTALALRKAHAQLAVLAQIDRAIARGEGLGETIALLARTDLPTDALRPFVTRPIPEDAALRLGFEAIRPPAPPASASPVQAPLQPQSWSAQMLAKLQGLVVVRRPGEAAKPNQSGLSPEITPIKAALASGNLAEALRRVETLPADLKPHYEDWRKEAEATLQARTLLDQTRRAAVEVLGKAATPDIKGAP